MASWSSGEEQEENAVKSSWRERSDASSSASDEEEEFICDLCQKSVTCAYHLERCLPLARRPLVCATCGHSFWEKYILERHIRYKHAEDDPSSSAGASASSQAHPSSDDEPESDEKKERLFVCGVCLKSFLYAFHLRLHKHVHTAHRPHVCATCGRGYWEEYNLARHIRLHHAEDDPSSSPGASASSQAHPSPDDGPSSTSEGKAQ